MTTDEAHITAVLTSLLLSDKWCVNVTVSDGVWAELAVPIMGRCCSAQTAQTTPGPCWDWVDSGEIRGSYGGQCYGCGSHGRAWVCSGAVRLADTAAEVLNSDTILSRIVQMQSELVTIANGHIAFAEALLRGVLRCNLADWMAMDDEARECSGLGGSEMSPGIYDARSYTSTEPEWVSWDYHPNNSSEIIEVTTERNLAMADSPKVRLYVVLHTDGSLVQIEAPTAQEAMLHSQKITGKIAVRAGAEPIF